MKREIWWGDVELELEGRERWVVGPLELWLARYPLEWRVGYRRNEDPSVAEVIHGEPWPEEQRLDEDVEVQRFAFKETPSTLTLTPILADRPLVARTETPLILPSGEEMVVYVSTPVWVKLGVAATDLLEVTSYRPSDTWFGPTTGGGELCYGLRSRARVERSQLEEHPARAVTALTMRNHSSKPLAFDRLKLPVQHLELHSTEDFGFWTSSLTVEHESSEEAPLVKVESRLPEGLGDVMRVSDARAQPERGGLRRALGALWR